MGRRQMVGEAKIFPVWPITGVSVLTWTKPELGQKGGKTDATGTNRKSLQSKVMTHEIQLQPIVGSDYRWIRGALRQAGGRRPQRGSSQGMVVIDEQGIGSSYNCLLRSKHPTSETVRAKSFDECFLRVCTCKTQSQTFVIRFAQTEFPTTYLSLTIS